MSQFHSYTFSANFFLFVAFINVSAHIKAWAALPSLGSDESLMDVSSFHLPLFNKRPLNPLLTASRACVLPGGAMYSDPCVHFLSRKPILTVGALDSESQCSNFSVQ